MKKLLLLTILIPSIAFAQAPQQPTQPPEVQALSGKLMEEINNSLQLRSALINDQRELKRLQDENADLKKKLEEKDKK